ncbi:Cytochrome c biogenesis protein CcdA [Cryobacterium flavum]|uniref:Cytochrome c biogenesis protein CcdA n=1 Tax=Cryobacterium flavum TaxID=1424659 RepID=A0A4R8V689_9MICO|nr:cytochrome c biogenesis CcdA family protein [Cryobacterium flavum]TFB77808.1 cytochrome c biogenesis protein CcdA [Cryobacterium flavum]SDM60931.1 Cytochrome c biogenesis protein CcdA [Cryobacterium flavum]
MDIGYAGALIGGMLTLLSPCSVMLLPAFFAYAFAKPSELLARTGLFYLGLITTLVPLGVLAGTVGVFVTQNRTAFVGIASLLVVLMGIIQISGLRFPAFTRGGAAEGTSAVSVYLLGAVYGVAGVCAGPILGSVLTVAALGSNAVYGGVLLAIYALGMAAPLIVLALLWDRLSLGKSRWLRPRMLTIGRWENSWLMIVSGILSILIGVFLFLTDGTASLGGVLTIGDQFATEVWVLDMSSLVTNLGFGIAAIVVLGLIALAYAARNRRTRRQRIPQKQE